MSCHARARVRVCRGLPRPHNDRELSEPQGNPTSQQHTDGLRETLAAHSGRGRPEAERAMRTRRKIASTLPLHSQSCLGVVSVSFLAIHPDGSWRRHIATRVRVLDVGNVSLQIAFTPSPTVTCSSGTPALGSDNREALGLTRLSRQKNSEAFGYTAVQYFTSCIVYT